VFVPLRIADLLARLTNLDRVRKTLRGHDPEFDVVALAIAQASSAYRVSVEGSVPAATRKAVQRSPQWLKPSDVADQLGVTPHRVRQEIRAGRLLAERDGRTWQISRIDFEQYRAARAA
jgi:excisionase family DNA binding protein